MASRSPSSSRTVPLYVFFSTLPRPPRSTLFPFTTLFRSVFAIAGDQEVTHLSFSIYPDGGVARLRDRKSTRLNSSHANISYAVFCLKKKKTPGISVDPTLKGRQIMIEPQNSQISSSTPHA